MNIDSRPEFQAALITALRKQFPKTTFEIKFSDFTKCPIIIWWPTGLRHCRVDDSTNRDILSFIKAFKEFSKENKE